MRYLVILLFALYGSIFGQKDYQDLIQTAQSFEASNPDSILFYSKLAMKTNEKNQSDAFYWRGVGFRLKNNLDSAYYWYNQAMKVAETDIQQANAYMGLGGLNHSMGNYQDALSQFIEASKLYELEGDLARIGSAYSNIGIIMSLVGNVPRAKSYFTQSLQLFERLSLQEKSMPVLVNLASLYENEEAYDSAIYFAKTCYNLGKELNLSYAMARALYILAPSYIRSGKPETGYELAKEGFDLFENLEIVNSAASMKFFEAEALFHLNRNDESLNLCGRLEDADYHLEEQLFSLISRIYERKKDYKMALHYQQKFHSAYEEYEKKLKVSDNNRLEAQYQSERRQNEILLLENEIALQEVDSAGKNLIIISISLFTMFGLLSLWFYYQKRLSLAKEQAAIHKQQLLRSQINPHFIFNSLSSIRGFLFDHTDVKPAITYLGKFAKLMRKVMELSSKEWVTLEEEVSALRLYLEIQQIRFNKSFQFELKVDPSLDQRDILVPPLTAQPFIENAIEHGLKGIPKDGMVEIACSKKSGKLLFSIQDNGIGIDHVLPKRNHHSRAIKIFEERLQIIARRMKKSYSFDISDRSSFSNTNGTLVQYELPLLNS